MFSTGRAFKMKSACIIPTKDRKHLLERAIKSVLEQRVMVDEVVIVDDGSKDTTAEFIKGKYPFIKLIQNKGLGPGRARNLGASATKADILFFLDSDDQWLPNHVELLLPFFQQDYQVAYGITKTEDITTNTSFLIPEPEKGVQGHCFNQMAHWCHIVPSGLAVTKHAFEKVDGFPSMTIGEDWIFLLKLAKEFEFGFCNEIITLRCLHEKSLSFNSSWKKGELLSLIMEVEKLVLSCINSKPKIVNNISKMKKLVEENSCNWNTIQDWYLAAKERGLL